jgi:thiol-disulfide isomerase/thioredoxin
MKQECMARTESAMLPLGTALPSFVLPDPSGRMYSNSDFKNKPLLVAFLCNHCPYVKHLRVSFAEFSRVYMEKGLAIIAINPNDFAAYPEDSPENMALEIQTLNLCYPYLYDETQKVAQAFQATCTPDFFLFNTAHQLAYRGQYDDSRPGYTVPVTGNDLRNAADAVLLGKSAFPEQRPSVGCSIKWRHHG